MALVRRIGARGVAFRLGNREIEGRLPLIPVRGRLALARRRALGWTEEDDQRLAHAAKMTEDDVRAAQARGPSGVRNVDVFAAVSYAAIGLCWPESPPLGVPALERGGDIAAYGEAVVDALVVDHGFALDRVASCAMELASVVIDSVPAPSEVDEARDFSPGGTATSTAATS
jgi:hypothetical protein